MRKFVIDDTVTPVTVAGVALADVPVDGTYKQKRNDVCVFKGEGTIINVNTVTIDYDDWTEQSGEEGYRLGKVQYQNCLVECADGIGWTGQGALKFVR